MRLMDQQGAQDGAYPFSAVPVQAQPKSILYKTSVKQSIGPFETKLTWKQTPLPESKIEDPGLGKSKKP